MLTGGAGFIGSHLSYYLLERGHSVQVIDNLSSGSARNIGELTEHRRFSLLVDSVTNRDALNKATEHCDIIIHLAAGVGVQNILDDPLSALETNVDGTHIVLEAAHRHNKKVFLASSSEVYGKQTRAPLSEDDDAILGPPSIARWSYAYAKAVEECRAQAYHKTKGLPVIIGRLFNTVGPRQTGRYGMVVPRFVEAALNNDPILVHGDGSQSRTFTHVDDAVRSIYALVNSERAVGQVVNIGGSEEVTIAKLASTVCQMCDSQSQIKFVPYEKVYGAGFEDIPRRVPDTRRLQSITGISPSLRVRDILEDVIGSYRSATAT